MSKVDRNTLKSYFQAGDKPTESNYADLIDSFALEADIDSKFDAVNESIATTNADLATAKIKVDTNTASITDVLSRTVALEGLNVGPRLIDLEETETNVLSRLSTLESNTNIDSFVVACSSDTGDLATGVVTTFRMPYAFTLVDVRGSLTAASAGSDVTFNLSKNGTVITSTVTIPAGSKTTGVNTGSLLGENSAPIRLEMDDEIVVNVLGIGSAGTTGSGLKVTLVGTAGLCQIVLIESPIVLPITFPMSLYTTTIQCS